MSVHCYGRASREMIGSLAKIYRKKLKMYKQSVPQCPRISRIRNTLQHARTIHTHTCTRTWRLCSLLVYSVYIDFALPQLTSHPHVAGDCWNFWFTFSLFVVVRHCAMWHATRARTRTTTWSAVVGTLLRLARFSVGNDGVVATIITNTLTSHIASIVLICYDMPSQVHTYVYTCVCVRM